MSNAGRAGGAAAIPGEQRAGLSPESAPILASRDFKPWIILAALAACWFIYYLAVAPPYAGIDSFLFRDPGCAVAAGEGLISRSVPHGAEHVTPELFGAYTPGTPLLFGAVSAVFGCNPYTNAFYDLSFAVLVSALVLIALFRSVRLSRRRLLLAAVFGILLPSGVFFNDFDRPEIPAFCLLVALLLSWQAARTTLSRALLVGGSGIVFLFHPWAGITGVLLFGFLLVFEDSPRSFADRLKTGLAGGAIFAAVILACALYMQHLDPTVVHRFVGHAFGSDTGVGVVLNNGSGTSSHGKLTGFITAFRRTFKFQNSYLTGILNVAGLCVSLVLLVYTKLQFSKNRPGWMIWLQYLCLVGITFVLPFLLFFAQQNYFALGNGFLIVMLACGNFALSEQARRSNVSIALLLVVILFTLPTFAVNVIEGFETRASFKRATVQAARIHQEFAQRGLTNANILVDYFSYFLYRQYFPNLYNIRYLEANQSAAAYNGLLLCYASKFAKSRSEMEWPPPLRPADWQLIDSGEDFARITLFGKQVMRRNWAWGCDAYVRK